MERAMMWIMAFGAVIGGFDRIRGNRWGLGEKFENGFRLLGPTALSMVGILCLAPILSLLVEKTLAPACVKLGFDPALFGGILALDMGGYQLARDLAANPLMGKYVGLLVGAMLGCTVTFTIPVGMGMLQKEVRPDFARGILFGLIAMPMALLIGGVMSGLPLREVLWQSLPILTVSALLLLGIWKATGAMIRGFSAFARGIEWVTLMGLILAAVTSMTGVKLIPRMAPIEEAMAVVSSIGVVMLGSLPMAELLQRALKKPLEYLGRRTGMNNASVAALMIGMVSALPAIVMVKDMDRRGRVVNAANLVCAGSAFAAHLGFVAGVDASMIAPLLVSKVIGGLTGIAIALFATRKMAND